MIGAGIIVGILVAGYVAFSVLTASLNDDSTKQEVATQQATRLVQLLVMIHELSEPTTLADSYKFRKQIEIVLQDLVRENRRIEAIATVQDLSNENPIERALRNENKSLSSTVSRLEHLVNDLVLQTTGRINGRTMTTIEKHARHEVLPELNRVSIRLADRVENALNLGLITRLGSLMLAIIGVIAFVSFLSQRALQALDQVFVVDSAKDDKKRLRYDEVTGLPNKMQLTAHLKSLISLSQSNGTSAVVLKSLSAAVATFWPVQAQLNSSWWPLHLMINVRWLNWPKR